MAMALLGNEKFIIVMDRMLLTERPDSTGSQWECLY